MTLTFTTIDIDSMREAMHCHFTNANKSSSTEMFLFDSGKDLQGIDRYGLVPTTSSRDCDRTDLFERIELEVWPVKHELDKARQI